MSSSASPLEQLEAVLSNFAPDEKIEVEIAFKIHNDVPTGYVEAQVTHDGMFCEKVVDARGGIVTKSIRIFIPD